MNGKQKSAEENPLGLAWAQRAHEDYMRNLGWVKTGPESWRRKK